MDYKVADGPSPYMDGRRGMTEAFRDLLAAWEDWGVIGDDYLELPGDRILVSFHCSGRGKASGVDIAQLQVNGATLFEVGDGKITRIVQYSTGPTRSPTSASYRRNSVTRLRSGTAGLRHTAAAGARPYAAGWLPAQRVRAENPAGAHFCMSCERRSSGAADPA